jgi:hypothetical protein
LRLDLGSPGGPGDEEDLETDAGLVAADFASLTALVGVREAGPDADLVVAEALELLGCLWPGGRDGARPAHPRSGAAGTS